MKIRIRIEIKMAIILLSTISQPLLSLTLGYFTRYYNLRRSYGNQKRENIPEGSGKI